MEILLTEWFRTWHGENPQPLKVQRLPLENEKVLFALVVQLGNGNFEEACFDFDSVAARETIVGMLRGTGGAERINPDSKSMACRLYKEGYEVYRQGDASYFFVSAEPRPELFESASLAGYIAEFREQLKPPSKDKRTWWRFWS